MSNMAYPPELYENLTKFARAHVQDKFNAVAMLFALQLWVDIVEHPTRMAEYMPNKREDIPIPHVPLSIFLVYFESWLKAHEDLRCLQYIHPCRVMNSMYISDLEADSTAFLVHQHIIDEDNIRGLVLRAAARRAELPVQTRVDYYPFLMNGTSMAAPQDFNQRPPYSPTEQALIGMPSIQILGLPSFHPQPGHKRQIALPQAIARLSFHGLEVPMADPAPAHLQDVKVIGLTSQFGQNATTSRAIWSHEFCPDMDPIAVRQRVWVYTPALDPSLPASHFINPVQVDTWFQKVNRRLRWLDHLGVMGKVELHCGIDGLPGFHGMPLEDEAHLIPPSSLPSVLKRAWQDPVNRKVIPEVQVIHERFHRIISTLADRHPLTHVAWKRALDQLRMMTIEEKPPTAISVIEILTSARKSCNSDLDQLRDTIELAEERVDALLQREPEIRSWTAQTMVRLVGEDAGPEADPHWWHGGTPVKSAIEMKDEEAYFKIEGTWVRLRYGVVYRWMRQDQELATVWAKKALYHMKAFLDVQKNGPLIDAIDELIKDLQDYVQSKGQGNLPA